MIKMLLFVNGRVFGKQTSPKCSLQLSLQDTLRACAVVRRRRAGADGEHMRVRTARQQAGPWESTGGYYLREN